LAICTAKVPTPPDAPFTSIFSPALSLPKSRTACSAVMAAIGTAAASSNEMFAGFITMFRLSRTRTYSENAPSRPPNTSSPGLNFVTLFPTDSTTPAKSTPSNGSLGLPTPEPIRRMTYGLPRM
jgi:hypothetical protein